MEAERRIEADQLQPLQLTVSALALALVSDKIMNIQDIKELILGSSSEEDDESPREVIQKNSAGSADFCVRKISQHSYGRREIEVCNYFTC